MPTIPELVALDVAALSSKIRSREISPVEVTEAYLGRIEKLDGQLKTYITVTADLARAAAKTAETEIRAGKWRGPFHGVPVAIKDLLYTKGVRTTGGSKILADFVPDHDATVWKRLAKAGAVLLGKLNLHEFAYGATSANPHWGAVRNPYDFERIPGGSSGGSAAAIAAGTAPATIGTDTGGSIRAPAAFCGCVGLKPTWGRVSRHGVIPLSYTLDHVGPITRTVRDAALMLGVIAGRDAHDSTASRNPVPDYTPSLGREIKGVRIGVIRELTTSLSDDVSRAFSAALQQLSALGAIVEEVSVPSIIAATVVISAISSGEALDYHEPWMRTRAADYGPDVRRMLELAMAMPAASYVRAQRARARILADAIDALDGREVLIVPTCAIPAPKLAETAMFGAKGGLVDIVQAGLRFTAPFDVTGQPALAIPIGLSTGGLPLSMQIVGRPFDESAVIRVADAYERARGPLPGPKI
ncbi:MAG TPA: amidase [Candidatus Binataceae bacterium]|nr:amidase [Candidatus Binataceae bacterium]